MLKLFFLFLAILFTLSNIIRAVYKNSIPTGNIILQAIGITGFIWLQFYN